MREYTILHLFCGIGGGALGFQHAMTEFRGIVGKFRTLGGIDVDPDACKDFETLTGAPAHQMDLFSRADYAAFHGYEPPTDWSEVTPHDLRHAAGERPDVVFLSPPCKGFSGLLPSQQAASEKYQALNRLVTRSMDLTLRAFIDDLPGLILIENVPRITTRGAALVADVKRQLGKAGYVFHEGYHDCGQIGGLAQHRRRFLLVARQPSKIPVYLHEPQLRRVNAIGSVLEHLPLPDDPKAGPMHRLPRLAWRTWLRLALIPAGGDWRDLEDVTLGYEPRKGSYRVVPWDMPGQTVIGSASVRGSNGMAAVADPRLTPRDGRHPSVYRVIKWDDPAACVTGTRFGSGAAAVSDPRLTPSDTRHPMKYHVQPYGEPAATVTGQTDIQTGAPVVADPRVPFNNVWRVTDWDEPAGAVTSGSGPSSSATCVADPRGEHYKNYLRVTGWDEPANTVTGSRGPHQGANLVADPRLNPRENRRSNSHMVRGWDDPACTVTGEDTIGSGAQSVADPRLSESLTRRQNAYQVKSWDEPSSTVTAAHSPSYGMLSAADPRLGCKPRSGAYRITAWEDPAGTVTGAGDVHSQGAACVADPRLPADNDRPDPPPVIISLDGTWHRPLTTLELAALQGFPMNLPDGSPLVLTGKSDSRWRERVGNAVPPPAAQAIGQQMLLTLMAGEQNALVLSTTPIWVKPEEESSWKRTSHSA